MDGSPHASSKIPEIFRNPDGSQWRIFVEAGGITGRPALIRNLKKAGAVVCSDPKQAQVILVDSNSTQGKLFIRDWGSDPNKVVLEYSWVKDSIAASKVLSREDQWGGYLTKDDGLPIANQEEEESLMSVHHGAKEHVSLTDTTSLLPTPRITPVEVATVERKSPKQQKLTLPDTSKETKQPVHPTQNTLLYPPEVQNPPLTQDVFQHLPPQAFATLMAQAQSMMQQHSSIGLGTGLPLGASTSNTAPQSILNFNQPYFPLIPQGIGSWSIPSGHNFGIPFFSPQMMNLPASTQFSIQPQPLPQNGNISNKGINKSCSSASDAYQRYAAFSPSTSASHADHEKTRSASPLQYPLTQSQPAPPSTALSSTLFRTTKGKELSFFVQIDLNNRSKVVTAIKKHGGIIVTSNINADYSILYSRSKAFDNLLKSTFAAGKPAISPLFVLDSVEQGKILETSAYQFDLPESTSRGKRKRAKTEDSDTLTNSVETKRLAKNRRERERKKLINKGKSSTLQKPSSSSSDATTSAALIVSQNESGHISTPRSPTPPPTHTRLPRSTGGGFMYTDYEKDYCRRYVNILLERDHNMSLAAIAQALYTKMDNHSLSSWRAYLAANFGTELETMRKRAGVAYQTTQNNKAREEQKKALSQRPGTGSSSSLNDDAQLRRETDIVAAFFATGGGRQTPNNDEEEDADDIWARLSAQIECRTAVSWEAFYAEHYEAVKKRYNELTEGVGSIST